MISVTTYGETKKVAQLTKNSAGKLKQLLPNLDKAEPDQQIWGKKFEQLPEERKILCFKIADFLNRYQELQQAKEKQ